MSNSNWVNWIIFIALSLVWGSSFILMKEGLTALSPYQVASLRMLFAGLVLLPFAVKSFRQIPKGKIGMVILSGLIGNFIPAFLFCIAETKIDSSLAGILNSLTPLFTIIVGVVFFKVQTSFIKILGIIIGFIGLSLLFAAGKNVSFENLSYTSLILIATFLYGVNVNFVGRYMQNIKALHITSIAFVFLIIPSTLILLFNGFFNLNFSNHQVIHATISSAVLGIVGTSIATVLFYLLVKRAGIIFASLVTYGIPFVAVAWGVLYGESIAPAQLACMVIILLAVYIVNRGNMNFIPFLKKKDQDHHD